MSRARIVPTLRGLPGPLPKGEVCLWQGSPRWQSLARCALHTRKLLVYFGLLLAWGVLAAFLAGDPGAAVHSALRLLPVAIAALGLTTLFAWLAARTTVYTITSRRVVLRIGIALPMTVNIPFRIIAAAGLKAYPDGTGDLPLSLNGDGQLAYLQLWPHARPWRLSRTEPMLRAIPEAAKVAGILAEALAAAGRQPVETRRPAAEALAPLASAAA